MISQASRAATASTASTASRIGPSASVICQTLALTTANAAVASTPASALDKPVNSRQGRFARIMPASSRNRPSNPGVTYRRPVRWPGSARWTVYSSANLGGVPSWTSATRSTTPRRARLARENQPSAGSDNKATFSAMLTSARIG
ncbi:hypothetical protein [Actinomadura meyerae]|uniref:hypothetical protein n=1 Tax=Actinomadura meyerae TaxID=240840 RepID=UPI000B789EAC|nr:hypothetical protein [Actinomadura meyerae]